jgi:hypothetical protein
VKKKSPKGLKRKRTTQRRREEAPPGMGGVFVLREGAKCEPKRKRDPSLRDPALQSAARRKKPVASFGMTSQEEARARQAA